MIDLYEKITTAIKNNDTSYLVTIINTNSKDPVNKIAKMLVYQNGETFGSINNAELEYTLTKDILKEKPLCVIQKEVCEVLKNVITKKTKYIGMIGNENKKNRIFDNLTKLNISDELLSKLHSPIGLNIRSKSSYEIAVSILAELIDVKNKH